jgi:SRSO17 transposase
MKRFLLLLLFGVSLLSAQSSVVSSIPLPKTYVQNLTPYDCDAECLVDLIAHEQIFSFLSQMPETAEDPALNEQRLIYVSLFNLDSGEQGGGVRIALLLPERVIGRYAVSTTNSVMAYLLGKNRNFELKTFQTGDESPEALEKGLDKIDHEGFHYVIAPLTKQGALTVAAMQPQANVFFPTVNAGDVNASGDRLYFGGIDYRAQIELLMREATPPLVIFYDTSELGRQLEETAKEAFLKRYGENDPQEYLLAERQIYTYPVDKHTTNLKRILKDNAKIDHGTFFLNTPLVKSGMIMSQLTLYDVNATRILSTQIGYDTMLFDITQEQDRKNMLVANSIGAQNGVLVERNKLLQNDIVYDWINYATTLGTDYFYHLSTRTPREYHVPIENHQVDYPVKLYRPEGSRFEPYAVDEEDDSLFPQE